MKFLRLLLLSCALLINAPSQAVTVTGDYAINFAPISNTDPYSNADFVELSGSTARIASGLWRNPGAGQQTHWILDSADYEFGDVIRAKVEFGATGGLIDGVWVSVMDASGNGYGVRYGLGTFARVRWDAFSGSLAAVVEATAVDGDILELEYTKSTGAVRVYHNSSLLSDLNLTDTTYAANTLQPGLAQRSQDVGEGGVRSFAADGLAGAASGLLFRRRRN